MSEALVKINQALVLTAEIRGQIAVCRSLEDAAGIAARARAIDDILAESNASAELRLQAAETYVLAEANLGRWLKLRPKGRPKKGSSEEPFRIHKTRDDRCRRLASSNGRLEKSIGDVRTAIYAKAKDRGRGLVEGDLRSMSVAGVLRELEPDQRKERNLLRPSDLWVFNPPKYGRIDDEDGHGYIPGDVYANILWNWSQSGQTVAAVMAGSGMIQHVYDDRANWLPDGESLELKLRLFDLNPRGQYKIVRHDARRKLPIKPDLIVMDVPYFGLVRGAYSAAADDIANAADAGEWLAMVRQVADASHASQKIGGRSCVVVASAYLDTDTGRRFQAGGAVLATFCQAGYRLEDSAYFGRAIQPMGGPQMRFINAHAVKSRRLLSEMTHVLLFEK